MRRLAVGRTHSLLVLPLRPLGLPLTLSLGAHRGGLGTLLPVLLFAFVGGTILSRIVGRFLGAAGAGIGAAVMGYSAVGSLLLALAIAAGIFVLVLLIGGGIVLEGAINAQQLTSYVMYVEFVTAASLSVCDQWGPFMEALGASERVIGYLDLPPAPQVAPGVTLPDWSGRVRLPLRPWSIPLSRN